MIIKRDSYLRKLIAKRDNGLVKVITGLRRSGKTFLLKELYTSWLKENGVRAENIVYIQLDKNTSLKYRNPLYLDEYLRTLINEREGRCYVMIDEIQFSSAVPNPYLPEEVQSRENDVTFYDTVLGLMDECDLYITGSNSEMLSSDILTSFRGRGDEIRVSPLSWSEYTEVFGDTDLAWRNYLLYGGMPYVTQMEADADKKKYLDDLFEKTYEKDIIERYKIRDEAGVSALLDYLASTICSFTNSGNIAQSLKTVSRPTVDSYIGHFENAFLLSEARRFDIRGKEYLQGQQKYYFTDLGLRNSRLNFRQYDVPHLLENVVYNELVRRGLSVDVGMVQTRVKNKNGDWQISYLESDFVINSADRKMYIQVAEGIDDPGKKKQEMASLVHIRDGFPKYILINQNVPKHYTEEGIIIMSIRDFLLSNDII